MIAKTDNSSASVAQGFTLMEVLIVVVLLGVLASIVAASFKTTEKESGNAVFAHDVRVAADGFKLYWLRNNFVFPADRGPGVTPAGMSNYLGHMNWVDETPIDGKWDWDYGVFGVTAAISVHNPDRTAAEMAEIDSIIDDGNLATGGFRSRACGYMMIIKE